MKYFEFKDTFCCSLFKESKYNTSIRPNLLGGLFQNDLTISCTFKAKNNNKKQYLFSKQGIVDSGVYILDNKIFFELSINKDSNNFSDEILQHSFEFNYDTEYSIIYAIDVEKNIFKAIVNDQFKETKFDGKVSDYKNVPLWIGTSNPFVENKNYFNGFIFKFEIVDNKGIVTDIDFTKINRFKVLDKSGNGNHAYIEEYGNSLLQERLNILIAGNPLKSSTTIKQTLL